jgi:hypothetical protein
MMLPRLYDVKRSVVGATIEGGGAIGAAVPEISVQEYENSKNMARQQYDNSTKTAQSDSIKGTTTVFKQKSFPPAQRGYGCSSDNKKRNKNNALMSNTPRVLPLMAV